MVANLIRFYFDFDEDCRTGCLSNLEYEDVDADEADLFETQLKKQNISYMRVDL